MTPEDQEKVPGQLMSGGCGMIGCGCLIPLVFVAWLLIMGALHGGK